MIYPALVLTVVGAAILFLMVYLVPQVLSLVETMGVALPLPTLILMAISNALRSYWLIGVLLALAVGIGLPLWVNKSEVGRDWWDRTQLRLPVIGPIVQKIVLSRFTNTLAMMYRSGVTVLDALRAAEMIAGNRVIASGIRRAAQQIADGRGLSESFQSLALFPPLVIRMLKGCPHILVLETPASPERPGLRSPFRALQHLSLLPCATKLQEVRPGRLNASEAGCFESLAAKRRQTK